MALIESLLQKSPVAAMGFGDPLERRQEETQLAAELIMRAAENEARNKAEQNRNITQGMNNFAQMFQRNKELNMENERAEKKRLFDKKESDLDRQITLASKGLKMVTQDGENVIIPDEELQKLNLNSKSYQRFGYTDSKGRPREGTFDPTAPPGKNFIMLETDPVKAYASTVVKDEEGRVVIVNRSENRTSSLGSGSMGGTGTQATGSQQTGNQEAISVGDKNLEGGKRPFTPRQQEEISKIQETILQDPIYKGSMEQLRRARNAEGLLNIKLGSADEAAKTQLVRVSGEVGNLTEGDIARFGGNRSLKRRAAAFMEKAKSGLLTEADRQDLIDILKVFQNKAEQEVKEVSERYIQTGSNTTGLKHDVIKNTLGPLFEIKGSSQNNSSTNRSDSGRKFKGFELIN